MIPLGKRPPTDRSAVYRLVDPRTGEVRYIGVTDIAPATRLRQHLSEPLRNNHKQNWFRELAQLGLRPILEVVAIVPHDARAEAEKQAIAEGRRKGWPLTNLTGGGDGWTSEDVKRRWIDPEYRRRHPVSASQALSVRIWRHIARTEDCWIWTGNMDPAGPGKVHVTRGVKRRAHVAAWELVNRESVPDGYVLTRTCGNRRCVRPDHGRLTRRAEQLTAQNKAIVLTELWKTNHRAAMLSRVPSILERFHRHVEHVGDCWIWTGARNSQGYGAMVTKHYTQEAVHRVAYRLFIGEPPPRRMIWRTCENKLCVRPDHLTLQAPSAKIAARLRLRQAEPTWREKVTRANKARVEPAPVRFWRFVEKSQGCWNWTGARHAGFGIFNRGRGKQALAHRFSWELAGGSLTRGARLRHACGNRICVRTDHLELARRPTARTERPIHE